MAREYRPGEIVPQSGVYRITHDPVHADMPHELTVINRRIDRVVRMISNRSAVVRAASGIACFGHASSSAADSDTAFFQ